jgi:hypothetical protein
MRAALPALLLALVGVHTAEALPFRIESGGPGDGSGGAAVEGAIGPQGLDFSNGRLWIADSQRRKVKYIAGEFISTYAGTGITNTALVSDGTRMLEASFAGPSKIAVDPITLDVFFTDNGRLYVLGGADKRVYGVRPAGTQYILNVLAIPGKFLFIDSNKVWSCALPYSGQTWCQTPTHIAGTGSTVYNGDGLPATQTNLWPIDLAREPNGTLLVVDGGRLRRFPIGGAVSTVLTNLSQPKAVLATPSGDIYVTEMGGSLNRVSRLRDGVMSVILGNGAVVTVPQKWCMTPPCEGTAYPFAAIDLAYDDFSNTLFAVDQGAGIARVALGAVVATPTQTAPMLATATLVPTQTAAATRTSTRTMTPLPTCRYTPTPQVDCI